MTAAAPASSFGTEDGQTQIVIATPAHPLAAALSGTVTVTSAATTLSWGSPSANAFVVAHIDGRRRARLGVRLRARSGDGRPRRPRPPGRALPARRDGIAPHAVGPGPSRRRPALGHGAIAAAAAAGGLLSSATLEAWVAVPVPLMWTLAPAGASARRGRRRSARGDAPGGVGAPAAGEGGQARAPQPGFLERQLLALEKAERPSLLDFNLDGVYPRLAVHRVGVGARGGGALVAAGHRARCSTSTRRRSTRMRKYEYYDLQVGRLPHRGGALPGALHQAATTSTSWRRPRAPPAAHVSLYASLRYRALPAAGVLRPGPGLARPRTGRTSSTRTRATRWWPATRPGAAAWPPPARGLHAGLRRPRHERRRRPDASGRCSTTRPAPGLDSPARLRPPRRLGAPRRARRARQPAPGRDDGRRRGPLRRARRRRVHLRSHRRRRPRLRCPSDRPSASSPLRALAFADRAAAGGRVPFYLQEALGGSHTLRGLPHLPLSRREAAPPPGRVPLGSLARAGVRRSSSTRAGCLRAGRGASRSRPARPTTASACASRPTWPCSRGSTSARSREDTRFLFAVRPLLLNMARLLAALLVVAASRSARGRGAAIPARRSAAGRPRQPAHRQAGGRRPVHGVRRHREHVPASSRRRRPAGRERQHPRRGARLELVHEPDRRAAHDRRGDRARRRPWRPPDVAQPLTVIAAKSGGITPGFTMRDARGHVYFVKFDPAAHPEPLHRRRRDRVAFLPRLWLPRPPERRRLHPPRAAPRRPGARVSRARGQEAADDRGRPRPHPRRAPPAGRTARIRIVASRGLAGEPVGPFEYRGTRADDANDVFPHEHRRELRGLRVFAAWLNHDDSRSLNTLDMFVAGDGGGYVRHHLIDFSSTLGSGSNARARDRAPESPGRQRVRHRARAHAADGCSRSACGSGRGARCEYPVHPEIGPHRGRLLPSPRPGGPSIPTPPSSACSTRTPSGPRASSRASPTRWCARSCTPASSTTRRRALPGGHPDPAPRQDGRPLLPAGEPAGRVRVVPGAAGPLRFRNLGEEAGLGRAEAYEHQWFRFDNGTARPHAARGDGAVGGDRDRRPSRRRAISDGAHPHARRPSRTGPRRWTSTCGTTALVGIEREN